MIKAIFFATFDVHEGPKIHHQVPPNSIQTSSTIGAASLFSFPQVSKYLIPHQSLTSQTLTLLTPPVAPRPSSHHDSPPITQSLQHRRYRILSHPITINSPQYPRNAYTFNFCLVLDEDTEFHAFVPVVRKLAGLFRALEESSRFLSTETAPRRRKRENWRLGESDSESEGEEANQEQGKEHESRPSKNATTEESSSRVYAIIETLREDLNLYSECMIPISSPPPSPSFTRSSNPSLPSSAATLNLKLFPPYPTPPKPAAWHVPVLLINLKSIIDESWDLTLLRILRYINGVNSVKKIAALADADFKLVRKGIRELVFYGCVGLLDIFSFGAIYAPTATIGEIVEDKAAQEECARYVALPTLDTSGGSNSNSRPEAPPSRHQNHLHNNNPPSHSHGPLTPTQITTLYLSLRQGQPLKAWAAEHMDLVRKLDLRRFITFGVIKGFLYRIHRYPICTPSPPPSSKRTTSRIPLRPKHPKAKKPTTTTTTTTSTPSTSKTPSISNKHHHPFEKEKQKEKKGKEKQREEESYEEENEGDEEAEAEEGERSQRPRTTSHPRLLPPYFLDGTHHFDEICTEMEISERELMGLLRGWGGGEVVVVCR